MSRGDVFRYLSRDDVISLGVTPSDVQTAIRGALIEKTHDARTAGPPKAGVHPRPSAAVHAATAFLPSSDSVGIKWIARYPENPQSSGLPACDGLFILNEGATGRVLCVLDASWLTELRTAVASALALSAVRPDGVDEVSLLGFGAQGRSHLAVLPQILPGLSRIRIHSRRPDQVRAELRQLHQRVDGIVIDDPQDVLRDVPAVISAIPMTQPASPIYDAACLLSNSAVIAIDFDAAWKPTIFDHIGLFAVDDVAQYRWFTRQGWFENYPSDPVDLSDILRGHIDAPQDQPVYVNCLGLGIEDVAVANLLFAAAEASNVGTMLDR